MDQRKLIVMLAVFAAGFALIFWIMSRDSAQKSEDVTAEEIVNLVEQMDSAPAPAASPAP